jgi:hypothetical protein
MASSTLLQAPLVPGEISGEHQFAATVFAGRDWALASESGGKLQHSKTWQNNTPALLRMTRHWFLIGLVRHLNQQLAGYESRLVFARIAQESRHLWRA